MTASPSWENDRFKVVFDKRNEAVLRPETMTATIRIEHRETDELEELRRLATEFDRPEPQTFTTA